MTGSDGIKSAERTVLRAGETDVELTFDDAKAIQKVLGDYLQQSTYPDRDELLKWSGPAFIDGDGKLRIGLWVLGWDGKNKTMFLRLRETPGQLMAKAHKATLARTDGQWTITGLGTERIRLGRR
jgi:hypothetical protein